MIKGRVVLYSILFLLIIFLIVILAISDGIYFLGGFLACSSLILLASRKAEY